MDLNYKHVKTLTLVDGEGMEEEVKVYKLQKEVDFISHMLFKALGGFKLMQTIEADDNAGEVKASADFNQIYTIRMIEE